MPTLDDGLLPPEFRDQKIPSRAIATIVVSVLAAAVVTGGLLYGSYLAALIPKPPIGGTRNEPLDESTSRSSEASGQIANLDRQISANPCNQPAVLTKVVLLSESLDFDQAASLGQDFLNRCDKDPQIGFATMESWFRLSEFQKALSVIDLFPEEAQSYVDLVTWKGFVLEKLGRHDAAASAFERSLLLFHDLSNVAYDQFYYASRAYKAVGRYCDAMRPLELFVSVDPASRLGGDVKATIDELRVKGACPDEIKGDKIVVKMQRRGGLLLTTSFVNGLKATLVLDTGASTIHLSQKFAEQARIPLDRENMIKVTGVAGSRTDYLSTADRVSVGSVEAFRVIVTVASDNDKVLGEGIDGLLGQTFLSRYRIAIDGESLALGRLGSGTP